MHADEALGEGAAAEEAAELVLDESRDRPVPRLRMCEKALGLEPRTLLVVLAPLTSAP